MTIFDMANTRRHAELLQEISDELSIVRRTQGFTVYRENIALVHMGHRVKDPSLLALIDIEEFDKSLVIDNLNYIQPDFMIFQDNPFLWNKKETRLAGCPDLIIEIWSDSDYPIDKQSKFLIYSNSNNKTEHWYIEQGNNEIECFIGKDKTQSQDLSAPLKTRTGLKFNLASLAL